MNVEETPKMASAPNHVAKTVAITTGKERLLPATAKSLLVFTFLAAKIPIVMVKKIYIETRRNSIFNLNNDKAHK